MRDPTIEEMRSFLSASPLARWTEVDEFDIEEAIYWFACFWHGGQWSNLYAALSTSPFSPGPLANGPAKGGNVQALVRALEDEYTDDKPKE
jgi:hypothetical protein